MTTQRRNAVSLAASGASAARLQTLNSNSLIAAAQELADRDRYLKRVHERYGPPPMWARRPGFPTLLRIILEQQVSLISARAMLQRLTTNIQPFTPERFIELGEEYLRSLGLTRQKSHYCVQLATAFRNRELDRLSRLPDADARDSLLRIKGIGPWTADIYLLMALRRADIWPQGDIALATAFAELHDWKSRPDFARLAKAAVAWRPYRSVAARMLWQYYLGERGRL